MLKTLLAEVKQYKKASILTPVFMVGEVVMEILIPMLMAYLIDNGVETASYSSLVATAGRVHYTDVHGLTAADLHGAPSWPETWRSLLELLDGIDTVVAFRATFDRGALLTMCGQTDLKLTPFVHGTPASAEVLRYRVDVPAGGGFVVQAEFALGGGDHAKALPGSCGSTRST